MYNEDTRRHVFFYKFTEFSAINYGSIVKGKTFIAGNYQCLLKFKWVHIWRHFVLEFDVVKVKLGSFWYFKKWPHFIKLQYSTKLATATEIPIRSVVVITTGKSRFIIA